MKKRNHDLMRHVSMLFTQNHLSDQGNKDYALCELGNFLLGQQKMFDLGLWKEGKEHEKAIINIFSVYEKDEKENVFLDIKRDKIYLVHRKHLNLYKKFQAEKNLAKAGQIYGSLMGFADTATHAWLLDGDREVDDRK